MQQPDPLTFRQFIERVAPKFRFYPHIDKLIRVLQQVTDGDISRLMVFMPPRHGKSETVSRLFTAYYLYRYPHRWVAINSYAAELAFTLSRNARENYTAAGGPVSADAFAVKHWETGKGGGLWATGVGGPATGKGFHCFPGDTRVITDCGIMKIETLCQSSDRRKVLSFNHATNKPEWRRIVATALQAGKPLVEITLSSGCRIRCTADHPIYSVERGYRQAGNLVPGETVIQVKGIQDLCEMRGGNESSPVMQPMSTRHKGHSLSNPLRSLQKGVHQSALSGREISSDELCRSLLFSRVQPSAPRGKESKNMQDVWRANRNQDEPVLRGLPQTATQRETTTRRKNMPILWSDISAQNIQASPLLQEVRGLRSFDSDARQGEQSLQDGDELRRLVSQNAPRRSGKGRALLRHLRRSSRIESSHDRETGAGAFNPGDSSHRSRPYQQLIGKPDNDVLGVSFDPSQGYGCWQTDTVSTVARVSEVPNAVYDIQVEGNCNFFADGILVHNCGIIDDPLKNSEEAASETIREKQKDWYRSTFSTREEPGGAVIVIMTRWNQDDLAGWLLAREAGSEDEPEGWHIVNMPAVAEDRPLSFPASCTVEPDEREPGEALCPERYSADKLRGIMRRLGSYFWAALFQQRPAPRDGDMFRRQWFSIVQALPSGCRFVRYWDKAGSAGRGAYTAGVLMAVSPDGRYYVVNVQRGQWSFGQREAVILQTAHIDQQRYREVAIWVEQEGGSGGKESAERTVINLAGFTARAEPVTGDKELRAGPFAAQAEVGNVSLLAGDWNESYLEELTAFPNGTYKDRVDASSGAFNKLATRAAATGSSAVVTRRQVQDILG